MPTVTVGRGRGRITGSLSRGWRGSTGPVRRGVTSGTVREVELDLQAVQPVGRGRHLAESCSPRCRSRPTPLGKSTGSSRSTPRSRACISTARPSPGTQGAVPNHKNPWSEPPDHGIGRSRGGLTTKLHLVCDGRGRPLSMMINRREHQRHHDDERGAGEHPRSRDGKGRPRTRPDRVLADKGYPQGRTAPGSATGGSRRPSPSGTTRSRTAARSRAGRSLSATSRRNATRDATS